MPITSQGHGEHNRTDEIPIPDPEQYYLTAGSWIRERKIFSIHPSRQTKKEGPIDALGDEIVFEILEVSAKLYDVEGDAQAR